MRIFRLIFTCFLSLAILTVGSAAVAMPVDNLCSMQQMQTPYDEMAVPETSSMMMSMDMSGSQSMSNMDCMEVVKKNSGHSCHCKSGQDCAMYNAQLAYPASTLFVTLPTPHYLIAQRIAAQSTQYLPSPDLFGLWRPPRAV